jgi:hypothetical protein
LLESEKLGPSLDLNFSKILAIRLIRKIVAAAVTWALNAQSVVRPPSHVHTYDGGLFPWERDVLAHWIRTFLSIGSGMFLAAGLYTPWAQRP